jgi:hydroxymethylbilane synthase
MTPTRLVLATRRSALALAQARAFARDLAAHWPGLAIEELQVVTTGDKVTNVPLSEVGGKGLFTKEIEEALDRGDAHFAVHSFKDVPAELSAKFAIACVPVRADPRDVLVTRSGVRLDALPSGARIGTSSLRRAMLLALARPDLTIVPLRGNVDTRLGKLDSGELDAIVLASAGLGRLGLSARATEALDPIVVVPAPGQGALAIECRADDAITQATLAPLTDADTEIAVACERGVMHAVGGSCTVPFGAYAFREGETLHLHAILAGPAEDAPRRIARTVSWPSARTEAAEIGRDVGRALLRW